MEDLSKLSPAALKAAMTGGTAGWGQIASAETNVRYSEPWPKKDWRSRRKCPCRCGKKADFIGMANGISLTFGCEFTIKHWVKYGFHAHKRG